MTRRNKENEKNIMDLEFLADFFFLFFFVLVNLCEKELMAKKFSLLKLCLLFLFSSFIIFVS